MEEPQKYAVEYGRKIEKMSHLVQASRLAFASTFVISAWREFQGFDFNGDVAVKEYSIIGLGIVKAKYVISLGIAMKMFGGILLIFNTYVGAMLLLIYQAILSPILYYSRNGDIIRLRRLFQGYLKSCEQFRADNKMIRKTCDRLFRKHVNQTDSVNDKWCYPTVAEELTQKICDQIQEVKKIAMSNPILLWFDSSFMLIVKGGGIVVALVFFIVMKRKHEMLKKPSKEHKTN